MLLADLIAPKADPAQAVRTVEGGSPANPLAFLMDQEETWAGVQVSEEGSISASAVFSAVRLLAESESRLPLKVFQRVNGEQIEVDDDPAQRLIHVEANEEQTATVHREQGMGRCLLWGDWYSEIERNRFGDPVALWPLHPDRMSPERGRGGLWWNVAATEKEKATRIRDRDVFHVPGFTLDGLQGIGIVTVARQAISASMAADRFGAKFFGNYMRPQGYLSVQPGGLGEDPTRTRKEIAQGWRRMTSGQNLHGVAVLEGIEWKSLGINPDEAQYLETRRFNVAEIARFFRVPPHLLMELEKATFNNIEELGREFVRYSLTPWLVKIEQEINRKLLRDGRYAKHNADALLRGNTKEQAEAFAMYLDRRVMLPNEVRARLELNPIPGGDEPIVMLNTATVQSETPENTAETSPEASGDAERLRVALGGLLIDACHRIHAKIQHPLDRLVSDRSGSATDLEAAASRYRDFAGKVLDPILESLRAAGMCSLTTSAVVDAWAEYQERRIRSAIEENTLAELADEWRDTRAEAMAAYLIGDKP